MQMIIIARLWTIHTHTDSYHERKVASHIDHVDIEHDDRNAEALRETSVPSWSVAESAVRHEVHTIIYMQPSLLRHLA